MKMTIDHILDLIEQLPKNEEFDYVSGGESKAKLISIQYLVNFWFIISFLIC